MTSKITTNITVDAAYEAVAPDDFPAMMEVDRYGKRSTASTRSSPRPMTISGTRRTRSMSTSPRPSTWKTNI